MFTDMKGRRPTVPDLVVVPPLSVPPTPCGRGRQGLPESMYPAERDVVSKPFQGPTMDDLSTFYVSSTAPGLHGGGLTDPQ